MNPALRSHPPAPAGFVGFLLHTRTGLAALLLGLILFNLLEVRLEVLLGDRSYATGYKIAAILNEWEGALSFAGQESVGPAAVAIYSLFYFFAFPLLLILVPISLAWGNLDLAPLRRFTLAVTTAFAFSLVFFVLLPVPERWSVPGTDAILLSDRLSTALVRSIRPMSGLDNCFPSMHVSLTVIAVFAAYWEGLRFRHAVLWCAIGIVASTFVLGIHWIPDIVAGVTTGVGSAAVGILVDRRLRHVTGAEPEERASDRSAVVPDSLTKGVPAGLPVAVANGFASATELDARNSRHSFNIEDRAPATPRDSQPPIPFAPGSPRVQEGDIFVSYSSKDREQAQQLVRILGHYGYLIWLDRLSIHGGQSYADKIGKALRRARVVIVLISEHSLLSEHVKNELHLARNNKKTVLPILMGYDTETFGQIVPDDWSYLLGLFQSLQYSDIVADHATILESLNELGVYPQLSPTSPAAERGSTAPYGFESPNSTPPMPPSATEVPFPFSRGPTAANPRRNDGDGGGDN